MKQAIAMPPQVPWFLLSSALVIVSTAAVSIMAASSPLLGPPWPGCPSKCGSIDIPYPFGIGGECSWQGEGPFTLVCNHSFSPPKLYTGNIEIANISVETGEMHVYTIVASVCYNSSNTIDYDRSTSNNISWTLDPTFLISPTENIFTAIGCDTLALLEGGSNWNYFTGCISYCASLNDSALDETACTGLGCCQTSIPGNLTTIQSGWYTDNTTFVNNYAWEYSPCKHAFVAQKDSYKFRREHLEGNGSDIFINGVGDRSDATLVLDWAIRGNGSCPKVLETSSVQTTAPACPSANSDCEDLNATRGGGYLCKCSKGYMGNPYIPDGCRNINECTDPRYANTTANGPCGMYSKCKDTNGDYLCECNHNRKGDGKSEKGCYHYKFSPYAMAGVVALVSSAILVILLFLLQKEYMRRTRIGFVDKNGGKILKGMDISIFTEDDLKKITNQYRDPIGNGAFGMVFKGRINDNQLVAVKRPIVEDEKPRPGGEFIDEITFQIQIRHANLVRLIGCCLETKVPMLVFEFIPNGSLHDVLHGTEKPQMLSLQQRIDIAIGSAEALTYMHMHSGHNNRIHGDVKPGNILLDRDLKPKVSDFGSSKLVSTTSRYEKWSVRGDMSYIDPVYITTGCFTEKSDVYSFGVVLLELITRKKAKYGESNSLPTNFVKLYKKEGNGRKMYDTDVFSNVEHQSHSQMECLDRISMLAVRCLKGDVDERPTMAEVVAELKQIELQASRG